MTETAAGLAADWVPSDRDALEELIVDALAEIPGFAWYPCDLADAAEAVVVALEQAGLVPTLAPPEEDR